MVPFFAEVQKKFYLLLFSWMLFLVNFFWNFIESTADPRKWSCITCGLSSFPIDSTLKYTMPSMLWAVCSIKALVVQTFMPFDSDSLCYVAVNELARYCGSHPSRSETFNSTSNEVTVHFHSDDYSNSYYVNRGFSLRFNTSQEGEFNITACYICLLVSQLCRLCSIKTCPSTTVILLVILCQNCMCDWCSFNVTLLWDDINLYILRTFTDEVSLPVMSLEGTQLKSQLGNWLCRAFIIVLSL